VARWRSKGEAERRLAAAIPPAIRETRRALRLTQRQLADRCGLTQSQISRLETGSLEWVTIPELGRLCDVLGMRLDLALHRPYVASPPFQHDAAHARTVAYVARRLTALDWVVHLEVEIVEGRSHGWLDLLAYQPARRALLIVEVKAGLDDMGAAQRQLSWYERAAAPVARVNGWRVERRTAALLVLATDANDSFITANHGTIAQSFPVRAAPFQRWLADPSTGVSGSAVALVDPRSRRRSWLLPTTLDGRRTALRYATYADFIRAARTTRAARTRRVVRQGPALPRPRAPHCP
jgi:transcriptional regulator with XRE-family HTH domain